MTNQTSGAETLHPLVRQLIAEPLALRARCAGKSGGAARKLLRLTHATPREVFVSLLNSYLYRTTGVRYTRTPILPLGLLALYKDLDDLYSRVAEAYEATTGVVPVRRREFTVASTTAIRRGEPVTVPRAAPAWSPLGAARSRGRVYPHPPLVLLHPLVTADAITIDPGELKVTVID